jgi:hypothetical protein
MPAAGGRNELHLFISTGRFRSFEDMRAYIDPTYTEDGDALPSAFMGEVGLSDFEPGCIEAIHRRHPAKLATLLKGASYADQWLPQLDGHRTADSAICVFPPNWVRHPHRSSLEYLGSYQFEIVHPEWFKRLIRGLEDEA